MIRDQKFIARLNSPATTGFDDDSLTPRRIESRFSNSEWLSHGAKLPVQFICGGSAGKPDGAANSASNDRQAAVRNIEKA